MGDALKEVIGVNSQELKLLLDHPNVVIRHRDIVLKKMMWIAKRGPDALQVISDFDLTLTKHWVNGARNRISHGVIPNSGQACDEFLGNIKRLAQEYVQLERDQRSSLDYKLSRAQQIWEASNDCYVKEEFTRDFIQDVTNAFKITYREGTRNLLAITGANKIPVVIFSAGIGDVIIELLKAQGLLLPHVYVIANFMIFDESPPHKVIGFKKPVIHAFNKGEVNIKDTPFYSKISRRKNAILLGDSIGDLNMSNGHDHDVLLTVGFLNHEVEANISRYSSQFDVVVTNDSSFEWVNKLIESSINTNKSQSKL